MWQITKLLSTEKWNAKKAADPPGLVQYLMLPISNPLMHIHKSAQ